MQRFLTWLKNPLHLVLLAATLAPVYLVFLFIHTYSLRVPFADQWAINLEVATETARGDFDLNTLIKPYHGHRPLFTNAITAFSTAVWGWNPFWETFLPLPLGLVAVLLLWHVVYQQDRVNAKWLLPVLAALIFSLKMAYVWFFSANTALVLTLTFFLAGLWTLYSLPQGWKAILIAAACALCATFSFGNGILSFFLLGGMLWLVGYRRWAHLAFWSVVTMLIFWIYATSILESREEVGGAFNPLRNLWWVLIFLGNPLSIGGYSVNFAAMLGILGVGLTGVNVGFLGWRDGWRKVSPWVVLAGFGGGAGVLASLARLQPATFQNATAEHYGMMALPLWLALVCTMLLVVRHGAALPWLKGGNLLVACLLIPLYVQSALMGVMGYTVAFGRVMLPTPQAALNPESCVEYYPLLHDYSCASEFPLQGGGNGQLVLYLAAYRLTVFSDQPTTNLLADTYTAGSPVILNTPSVWLNSYINTALLGKLPPESLYHVAPDLNNDFFVPLPQPVVYGVPDLAPEHLANLLEGVRSAPQVWVVSTTATAENASSLESALREAGFFGTPLEIRHPYFRGADFQIMRYDRAPAEMPINYVFGEFVLGLWSVDNYNPRPCESVTVQSWWSSRQVPTTVYSATFTLVNEGTILRADGELAGLSSPFWAAERYYLDVRQLTIPCDAPPGQYNLLVGVYRLEPLEDLTATLSDGAEVGNRAYLTTVNVAP